MAVGLLAALVIGGLVASGSGGKDKPNVTPPLGVPSTAKSVDGKLSTVTSTKVVVEGDDGPKELTVTPRYARALDLPHLVQVHQADNQPVRVFYENQSGDDVALAAVDLPPS